MTIKFPVHIPIPRFVIVRHGMLRIAAIAELYCSLTTHLNCNVMVLRLQFWPHSSGNRVAYTVVPEYSKKMEIQRECRNCFACCFCCFLVLL